MSIHHLKSSLQSLLGQLAGRLAAMGLSAGRLTLLTTLVSVGIGALLLARPEPALFALVPVWMALRTTLDTAKAMQDGKSAKSGYAGEIAGVVSDAALYAPFALVAPFSLPWLVAIVLLAAFAEFAGARSRTRDDGSRDEGPMGRSDRALLFGALGALVTLFGTLPAWTWHIQPMTCVLLAWTIANRLRIGFAGA